MNQIIAESKAPSSAESSQYDRTKLELVCLGNVRELANGEIPERCDLSKGTGNSHGMSWKKQEMCSEPLVKDL